MAGTSGTILRMGWTDPRTGLFGAHPVLGGPLDLNDGVTFTLEDGALVIEEPPRELALAGNPRTPGERGVRGRYRQNRRISARLILGPMASASDLATELRALAAWVSAPPAQEVALEWQAPGAASPLYLDLAGGALSAMPDELDWLRLQAEPVAVVLSARPGLRGDRVWLQNLAPNPGFDAPAGPGVTVFSDPLTSVGAYTVQAGGSPTLSPANTYVDTLLANTPAGGALLRYYRLDEPSGTTVYDVSGQGQHGTTHGALTQGVAGLLSGDTDTCYTFAAASSQYVSCPTVGLPTGNAALSLGCWMTFAANPGGIQGLMVFYAGGNEIQLTLNSSGQVSATILSTSVTSAALSTGVAHFVVLTWDGTTLKLYVDGASVGTPATPAWSGTGAGPSLFLGAAGGPNYYYSGQIDEACYWSGALTATQVSNIYATGHSGASGTLASAMSVPAGARLSFGSPAWSAINTWQARMRYVSGQSSTWYPHYTDASDYLACTLSGSTLALVQVIAGVSTTLASVSVFLTHEAWYWLRLTQFPWVTGNPPLVAATLCGDAAGTVGASLWTVQAATADALTALTGAPQLAASGAPLVVGGISGGGHTLSLFGPGSWQFTAQEGTATGVCWGAWEQNATNTYGGGPVASQGAARIDLPASGSVDADWRTFTGGSPTGALGAMPVATAGDTLAAAVWVKSSGLSASATLMLNLLQFDASGTLLATTTLQSLAGNQAAWAQLSGSMALQTSPTPAAYAALSLRVSDATAGSAGAVVWWDNAQCWDVTATGQSSMPYCELRFPQSPAQLTVSGLLGDLPSPAMVALGTYVANFASGTALTWALGRRASASAPARLVGASTGYQPPNTGALAPGVTSVLDAASYGGYYLAQTLTSAGFNPRAFSFAASGALGVYHLFSRAWTAEAGGICPTYRRAYRRSSAVSRGSGCPMGATNWGRTTGRGARRSWPVRPGRWRIAGR